MRIGIRGRRRPWGDGADYQYKTIDAFVSALGSTPIAPYILNMCFMAWIVVLIGIYIVILRINKNEKTLYTTCAIILGIGLMAWMVGLLILYVFTYSEYEATRVASFSRYSSTYLVGVLYFELSLIAIAESKRIGKTRKPKGHTISRGLNYGLMALVVLLVFLQPSKVWITHDQIQNAIDARSSLHKVSMYSELLDYKTNKIAFISQGDNGRNSEIARYELTPIRATRNYWSLGKPYSEEDIYTKNVTPEEWVAYLKKEGCDYVYLHAIDNQFIETYGELFSSPPEAMKMYKLMETDSGAMLEEAVL